MEPKILRKLRKAVTFNLMFTGLKISQKAATPRTVEALRKICLFIAKTSIPLKLRLRKNMICAGIYHRELLDAYFERVVDQFAMLGHVMRNGWEDSGIKEKFIIDDESFEKLVAAHARGKGVLLIAPHIIGYPVVGRVMADKIPCSIYLRRNKDPRKMKINETLGLMGEGHLVSPPADATKTQRLQVAINVLREGRCLFVTPDTPRKPGDGVEVGIFGKKAFFPSGMAVMALRTGASLVPCWWQWTGENYRLSFSDPVVLERGKGKRDMVEQFTRDWGRQVDEFLHRHPEMWWNWLDKRWTYILRGVGKYAAGPANPAEQTQTTVTPSEIKPEILKKAQEKSQAEKEKEIISNRLRKSENGKTKIKKAALR